MKINNVESYALNKKFIVYRMIDGEAWFYDAWNDTRKAEEQSREINGYVTKTNEIEA